MKLNRATILSIFALLARSVLAADDSPVPPGEKPRPLNIAGAGEGPAWHRPSRSLYFTGGHRITQLDAEGQIHVFSEPSAGANGLLFDQQGRLIVCEAGNRRVTRTEADGSITVLADSYRAMKFNSPNDLTIDSNGRIYFSD